MANLGESILSGALASGAIVLALASCGTPGQAGPATPPASTTGPAATAAASGTASSGPVAPPGKTGSIQCGKATCQSPKQACCFETTTSEGKCVPVSADGAYTCPEPAYSYQGMRCDDAGDCEDGSVCCEHFASSDSRSDVICEPKICTTSTTEYCTSGSACRPGYACALKAGQAWGYCRQEHHSVKCGNVTCTDDKPICCWNSAKKQGTCAGACKADPDVASLSCTSSDDCGGYVCGNDGRSMMNPQAPPLTLFCMTPYETGNSTHATCKSVADCPERSMYGAKVKSCDDASPDMPPGSKWCVYGED